MPKLEVTSVRKTTIRFNSKVEDNETAPVKTKADIKAPIKGLLKKRLEPAVNGKAVTNGKKTVASNGKAKVEEKIKIVNAKKRKLEKMELDLEQSDEEDADNIAKHIFR